MHACLSLPYITRVWSIAMCAAMQLYLRWSQSAVAGNLLSMAIRTYISDFEPFLIIAFFNILHSKYLKKLSRMVNLKTELQYHLPFSFYGLKHAMV